MTIDVAYNSFRVHLASYHVRRFVSARVRYGFVGTGH